MATTYIFPNTKGQFVWKTFDVNHLPDKHLVAQSGAAYDSVTEAVKFASIYAPKDASIKIGHPNKVVQNAKA